MNTNRPERRRRWLAPASLIALACGLIGLLSASVPGEAADPPKEAFFVDVTKSSGITHAYENGQDVKALDLDGKPVLDDKGKPMGHLAILETLGGGPGLIDYDGDGLYDIFLPGGGTFTGPTTRTIVGRPCRLYKNLGNFKFKDVTKEVGLDKIDFYTHGVAVADYNNDGWPDLLVTGWGRLALFRNDPVDRNDPAKGRKFTDVTHEAGLNDHLWSTGAAWADFDGDGFVDLYVAHYVNWHFGKTKEEEQISHPVCSFDGKRHDVCPPKQFDALPHVVYRNNGDGTFKDVSKSAGLRVPRTEDDYKALHQEYVEEARRRFKGKVPDADLEASANQTADDICKRLRDADAAKEYGKGLGVIAVDINGDGKPDVRVACDTVDKLLYINRSKPGHILFEEMALSAGVARDDNGNANGSHGTDAIDLGSLRASLWCSNYENEKHGLYQNDCTADRIVFRYATQNVGIAAIGQHNVGWGTRFVDFDLDGREDLFVSNGHAIRFPNAQPSSRSTRGQKPLLMQCVEEKKGPKFIDVTDQYGGDYCATAHCGRGVAFGDLDNDGRTDLVLLPLEERAAVLKTVAGKGNHWIGFDLKRKGNRDPVGAKIILEASGKKQARFAKSGGSYLSANDPRHVFGLGKGDKIAKVTVIWPDLQEQTWEGLDVDRYWRLMEGEKAAK